MESKLSPDKEKLFPPVPLKTYQWEDLRRAREAGAYPWTHLMKPPLTGEITAEDIIRESTPRRSMSREFSKSRTHSPSDSQKILNLDSSPGSSRKHDEEGNDEGVHIPSFSKEVSMDSEDDVINQAVSNYVDESASPAKTQTSNTLSATIEVPKNISPKGILKRRANEQQFLSLSETREKTKCCHPLVNKIKHLADKTLHKLERGDHEKSPTSKRKKNIESQEIRQLKTSPGSTRRQKFSAIKLGDSDEMSKTLSVDIPPVPPPKQKDHIYEDIEEMREKDLEKTIHFSKDVLIKNDKLNETDSAKENESYQEKKSIASLDPSLVIDDAASLKAEEHIMEKLHQAKHEKKENEMFDDELDVDEPNVDEIFENQLDETRIKNDSPNITITEITDEEAGVISDQATRAPIESSPSPIPKDTEAKNTETNFEKDWSKPSSDHEYEIIEKPPSIINITYNNTDLEDKTNALKTDDELSSTTSLEKKYLQHPSDEEDAMDYKETLSRENNENLANAQAFQKDIEERYFTNTPSSMSRTECEISTSQVDSSALENLPLKRENRGKNNESFDTKLQQRFKEGKGKLKNQADKLKTKLQNIKTKQFTLPERPKINLPDRPKFKFPDRPKINLPDRPKFSLPDRRKFSLPDRPKFKKILITERLSFGDRKKFSMPDRPKFNVPKFKMPDKPNISFPSLNRKKESKDNNSEDTSNDFKNQASVDFETKTFPRLFNRKKKKDLPKTSSSPTLNREDTPPPTFTFTRVKKTKTTTSYIPDSPELPREYGNYDNDNNSDQHERKQFDTTYDFDKAGSEYLEDNEYNGFNTEADSRPNPDELSKQEYTHVISEINNDEFFVRPRGISHENIQVREYLSDEIRQAFKIPKNSLALMGNGSEQNNDNTYSKELEADPELLMDDEDQVMASTEDLNEKDDGYYTFPPVRPSRAKRKKKEIELEDESVPYIDESTHTSMQFSEIDLCPREYYNDEKRDRYDENDKQEFTSQAELRSIHEYANEDATDYQNQNVSTKTLPLPPKRNRRSIKREFKHSSLGNLKDLTNSDWEEPQQEEVIVYRTEHEYVVPKIAPIEYSPLPPRRNRSRSSKGSRGTSLCDDDRTSHGAESLTLDTNMPLGEDIELERVLRQESPGYATVDKGPSSKGVRRSLSKTPPARRRKSNSSERKYYTVEAKKAVPDRPPRKKSSTSLVTLDSLAKGSESGDLTQYVEIQEPELETHKDLVSGEVVSKMKDRPLPPPPRPPRDPKRKKNSYDEDDQDCLLNENISTAEHIIADDQTKPEEVVEIEVSTQTDPLPDDMDFDLGIEENLDCSMSSSLKDIAYEEQIHKSQSKLAESPRLSRPTSRTENSSKLSDPKISELSKSSLGRTSPTVILVERRVSSPTRINERDEMLTEASLTVQHIDIEDSKLPDVPPLPHPRSSSYAAKNAMSLSDERALDRISEKSRDIQLDNLITQRLQVRDLDVGRLNVSELQANKISVSDVEGMTLQVTELDAKSGHISVNGIEFSQSVIDEIVKKFAEISTSNSQSATLEPNIADTSRPISREEETQTEPTVSENKGVNETEQVQTQLPPSDAQPIVPPQRPPPPDLTPLLYSYLQDITCPSSPSYQTRFARDRPFTEFHESQHQSPPPPTRRVKRKPAAHHTDSSSDEMPLSRHPVPTRVHEPTIAEAGAQFFRVCQNSITRVMRNMFNSLMSYISGAEDKRDVQMALVIFLVLIAGLIMFGLSDSRTIHHHHWEFFNPPDSKPL